MLLFGLRLILQNITAMFLYNCTLPALRSLFAWKFNFFSPQTSRGKKKKKSSLKGILNKASAPVISGEGGLRPGLKAHRSPRRVPAGMRVLHRLCPGCLIYS